MKIVHPCALGGPALPEPPLAELRAAGLLDLDPARSTPRTRTRSDVIAARSHQGLRTQPVELVVSDYATYPADVRHLYRSRDGARALLTMTVPAQP